MLRGGEGARRGPRIDRMGGLVLAMIVGVLVPPLVVYVVASRDPLPRSCGAGQVSATRLDGAILHTTGADLWYSEGFPGQPRKLVDFAPSPARLSPGATPSPSAAATDGASSPASPAPAAPSASPSGSPAVPAAPAPRVVAADISPDRRLVALLVVDPPDRPGFISLRLMSPLDPPGKAPLEGWYTQPDRNTEQPSEVRILDNNKVLVIVGVPQAAITTPSPAVSAVPSPSPSTTTPAPSASPSVSPGTASAEAASPGAASPRVVAPPAGSAVVIVADPASARVVDVAALDYFLAVAHSGWPDTTSFRVPPPLPALRGRVDGAASKVAGTADRQVGTPLARRRLNQLLVGTAGRRSTSVVCSVGADISPVAFSPDESGLALYDGRETLYLDLGGIHAATRLLNGKILSWRG